MPVRDGGAWLGEAIESVLDQSFTELELVVVDDGSTDGSADVVRGIATTDRRVRLLEAKPAGIIGALERAREAAGGRFLARMDADDLAPADRIETQVRLLNEHPDVVLCGTPVRYFPRDQVAQGALRYEAWINSLSTPEEIERDLFVECPLAHPTFMARAASVEAVGGYTDRDWPEDYDLVLRLWGAGGRFARTSGAPLRWREHAGRLSRRDPRYSIDAFRRLKVSWLLRAFLGPNPRPVVICGAGPTGKAFQKLLNDGGAEVRAFVDVDSRKLGQDVNGAPVLPIGAVSDHREAFHLGAVSGPQARGEIRGYLSAAGLRELEDFVMVA